MARLSQGILGGVSGKIGNLVGSSWKGIAVIKTKALSVANPRTAGQVAQRTKMTEIVNFAQSILASIIKPLNDRFAQGMSGFNLFVSRNIDLFETSVITPADGLIISRGKMLAIDASSLVCDRSLNTAVLVFPTTLQDAYAQATDKIYALFVCPDNGNIFYSAGSVLRSAGTVSVALPADVSVGYHVDCYFAFLRSDGTVASDTSYIRATVVA